MKDIKFRNGVNLNKEQIQDIIDKYETHTSTELALFYNVPRGTIKYIWTKNNKRGKLKTRYRCNWNYFENIDSKDKAYFLGLMASDGCVYQKMGGDNTQKICSLHLQEQDAQILKLFKNYLKFEKPISITYREDSNHSNMHTISITSDKMADDLAKYNITERKTHTYTPIVLPKFMNHFIRGYFDGDGSIYIMNNSGNISSYSIYIMCGFKSNIIVFQNYLTSIGLDSVYYEDNRDYDNDEPFGQLTLTNVRQRYSFLKYLYHDCDDLYLKRKKEVADSYINAIDKAENNLFKDAIEHYNLIKENFI